MRAALALAAAACLLLACAQERRAGGAATGTSPDPALEGERRAIAEADADVAAAETAAR